MSKKRKAIKLPQPVDSSVEYQTIASHNKDYEPFIVMGVYPDIETARTNYTKDMRETQAKDDSYKHFAIRKVLKEQIQEE